LPAGYVALVSLADPAKPVVVMSAATNKLDEPGAEGSGRRKEGRPGPVVHDVRFYDCETVRFLYLVAKWCTCKPLLATC
jgi:hypothetical protein